QHAVVRHRRLGEEDGTRFAQPRSRRRVLCRRRKLGRGRAQRDGLALGRYIVLDGHRHAVERSDRLTPPPALLGRARLGERPLRRQEGGGLNMRLEARDALQHVAHRLKRRQRAAAIGVEQRDGAHAEWLHGITNKAAGAGEQARHRPSSLTVLCYNGRAGGGKNKNQIESATLNRPGTKERLCRTWKLGLSGRFPGGSSPS